MTKKRRRELQKAIVDTFERLWFQDNCEDMPPWPDMADAVIDALITKGLT